MARLTAAEATDTALAPMAVSVRTCLATEKVCWNRRFRTLPVAPALWAVGEGVLHLAENLRLAQHHGVEPGGHAERMLDGVLVRDGDTGSGSTVVAGRAGDSRRTIRPPAAVVAGSEPAVNLGAVAGGKDGRLARRRRCAVTSRSALGQSVPGANAAFSRISTGAVW